MKSALQTPYGAYELKSAYQKNMMTGTFSSLSFAAIIFVSVYIMIQMQPPIKSGGGDDRLIIIDTITDGSKWRPKPLKPIGTGRGKKQKTKKFISGAKLIPVDAEFEDSDIIETLPRFIDEPYSIENSGNDGDYNDDGHFTDYTGGYGTGTGNGEIPDPYKFIPFSEGPVIITEVKPEYPTLARETGFNAVLYVHVFIDIDGTVKDVRIENCSRPNVGFEEAAIAAAKKSTYKPAIQNGHPVAVWLSYQCKFTLKQGI